MQTLRSGAFGSVLKFILFGLLGMAVLGLALMGGNRFFPGGGGTTDVAQIEGQTITLKDFDKALSRVLGHYNMTRQQAYQSGLVDNVLSSEVLETMTQIEAKKLGLSLNKEYLQKRIAKLVEPSVKEGQTLQQTLDNIIASQRITEKEFIDGITREIVASTIKETVESGMPVPQDQLADDLYAFQNQTRKVDLIDFKNDRIKDITPPTDEQISKLYDDMKNTTYAVPELRHITIGMIDEKSLTGFDVGDDEIEQAYEDNRSNYIIPPKYVLSQTILQDEKQAQKVFDLTQNGKTLKQATTEVTGDPKNFFEKIAFEADLVMPQITDALKNKKIGVIVGPIKTPLGYHVVQWVDTKPISYKPLEDVEGEISKELLENKKMDALYDLSTQYDDLVAGGADFPEISKSVALSLTDIPELSAQGQNKAGKDAFSDMEDGFSQEDKTILIQTAFDLQKGELSRVIELPSGHFAAIRLDDIQNKTSKPLDDVKADIIKTYNDKQKAAANNEQVKKYLKDLKAGDITLAQLANQHKLKIQTIERLDLSNTVPKPLTPYAIPPIFKAPLGGYESINNEDGVVLVHITGYTLPDISKTKPSDIAPIKQKLAEETKNEAFMMYMDSLRKKYTAIVNKSLLKRVYEPKDSDM